MRKKGILVLTLAILLVMIAGDVLAQRGSRSSGRGSHAQRHHSGHHHHHRHSRSYTSFGFMYNMSPGYYPWYGSSVVAIPVERGPVSYIQRSEGDAPAENYWFYCSQPQGYYPWVKECQGSWQRIRPFKW